MPVCSHRKECSKNVSRDRKKSVCSVFRKETFNENDRLLMCALWGGKKKRSHWLYCSQAAGGDELFNPVLPHRWIDFKVGWTVSFLICVHVYDVQCVCAGACFHESECLCTLIQLKCWKFMALVAKAFGQQQQMKYEVVPLIYAALLRAWQEF